MASFVVSRYIAFSFFFFCCVLSTESVDKKPPFSFSFDRFDKVESQIALFGTAEIGNSTVSLFGKGRMIYKKPLRFFGTNPGFSTNFSFSISAGFDESFAFLMVPNNLSLISTRDEVSPRFLAVKFGTYVAIDVGGEISMKSGNLSDLGLNGYQKLQSWIDYDGASKRVEVRVGKFKNPRPEKALLSCPVDLSNVLWRDAMYVGMSSSSGQKSSIYSWGFEAKHGAPYLMHSDPLDPESVSIKAHDELPVHVTRSSPWRTVVALLIGAVCGALVASAVFVLRLNVVNRHPIAPVVEYPVVFVESGHEKMVFDGSKVVRD